MQRREQRAVVKNGWIMHQQPVVCISVVNCVVQLCVVQNCCALCGTLCGTDLWCTLWHSVVNICCSLGVWKQQKDKL